MTYIFVTVNEYMKYQIFWIGKIYMLFIGPLRSLTKSVHDHIDP